MHRSDLLAKPWARPLAVLPLLAVVLLAILSCGDGDGDIDLSVVYNPMLGGDTTALSAGGNAFELSARNLPNDLRRIFEVGDSFFNQNWVAAPSSTEARDGWDPHITPCLVPPVIAMMAEVSPPTMLATQNVACSFG